MAMTTTTTNDHYWRHFSDAMIGSQFYQGHFGTEEPVQLETGNQDADNVATTTYNECDPIIGGDYDEQEPAFNKTAANRTTTSNAARRHQQRYLLRSTKLAIPATTTAVTADVKEAYEEVQKPKTRAERRAVDEPLVAETETEALPVTKKERRSDYWVRRHDEFRNATRKFKTQVQVLSEDEEEDLPW